MKIVYCLNSIRYLGGIQRVTVVKANALAEVAGYDVYIIVTDNEKGVITEPLSDKVHLIDLKINYYSDDWKSKWNVLKGIIVKRRLHKEKLTKCLNDIQPDVVISVGQSEKNIVPEIKGKWKTVREFHYVKDYRKRLAHSLFDQILACVGDIYDFVFGLRKYDQIVTLTHEDKALNWRGYNNVSVIPNPSTFSCSESSTLTSKHIITTGRLSEQKNYASLIRAFRIVADQYPDWILDIYGDGNQKDELQRLIVSLNLSKNVFLHGYTSDVKQKMLESSFFVMTSVLEGFPLVLVEAMACGLPIVSYACPCGPRDIVDEGKTGFLINVNDENNMVQKICLLIESEKLRKSMGMTAKIAAKKYQQDMIIPLWINLFNRLKNCNNK